MRDRVFLAALSLLLCALPAPSTHARPAPTDTIYVDRDATGAEDGSSWNDAYTSLQEALEEARTNGTDDAVWVAEGTYYPDEGDGVQADDRTASFHVESGIDLHGRFEGNEDALGDRVLERGMNETVLSGEIQQDADSTNNAYTVLRLTGGAAGEIQVTGGQADGTGAQGEGGGAYITGGELHHAILTGNYGLRGSAVYAENSPTLAVVRATGNHATETGTVYLDGGAATLRHLTIADNTAEGGASGVQFVDSDATVEDFAFGPDATNDVQSVDFVTATYQGGVLEEGSTLANADITIRNNSADTLITTTETNAAGDYQATHTYPENQGYEAQIIADKADHQADTTTAEVGTSDETITNDFDLERRVHDLTITADDADTGTPVDAAGAITTGTDTLTTYQTGADGQTTIPVETLSDQVNVSANNDDYEPTTVTEQLGSDEQVTTSISLTPQPQDEPMTITVNAHEIGEDLYDGGYAPNPEDITVSTADTTITADFQNETATFTIPDTTSVEDITLSHDDTTDYHPAVSLFKTAEQNPIDLTQSTDEFDEFPREPYAQSNYGDNIDTNDRTITIPTKDLVDTYELRFIPSETPRGNSTMDDYVPHLNQGRSKRFKNRTVGDTTYTQDKLFIVEHNENNWLTKASNAYDDVRDTLPFPTSQPDTVSYDSLLTIRAERNYMNVTDIEEGSNGNAIFDGPRFIEESFAKASEGTTQGTTTSEAYSSFTGYGTTGDDEPTDTIQRPDGTLYQDEAAFPLRIQYSSFSDNDNF